MSPRPYRLDDPGALVPEYCGQGDREEPMHHTHIRVTDTRRDHLDSYLAELGLADLDITNDGWIADLGEYGGARAHGGSSLMRK